jgi:hypothetical protein
MASTCRTGSGKVWLLAETYAQREFNALNEDRNSLRHAEIKAYVPTYKRSIRLKYTRRPRIAVYPLLPRYLFLCSEDPARDIGLVRQHPDVWLARSAHGNCLTVPDCDMHSLQARQAAGEFDELSPAQRFPVGTKVILTLADARVHGTVMQVLRRQRARIALESVSVVVRLEALRIAYDTAPLA